MPKSRLAYILLGVFLGSLGIHNFYAGYTCSASYYSALRQHPGAYLLHLGYH
ncbi:MAG: TM2 domain-containing protein [Akkermansia sp.]|nr:TM2 domain-containing protein [Akkermansia sp.]